MPRHAIGAVDCVFHIPPEMQGSKRRLLLRIAGGNFVASLGALEGAARNRIPVVGCYGTQDLMARWTAEGRPWIYRDRGYFRRGKVASAGLPKGTQEGYWRWHINATQLAQVNRHSSDRFARLGVKLQPWRKGGRHIVIAVPSAHLLAFHSDEGWLERTAAMLRQYTDRPLRIRHKPPPRGGGLPLEQDLDGAHALVTHGSNAAVEAAVMGVPVFVDPVSAAKHVGLTDISKIESPVYPDREAWLAALAYCQFDEREMVSGSMWGLLE